MRQQAPIFYCKNEIASVGTDSCGGFFMSIMMGVFK